MSFAVLDVSLNKRP